MTRSQSRRWRGALWRARGAVAGWIPGAVRGRPGRRPVQPLQIIATSPAAKPPGFQVTAGDGGERRRARRPRCAASSPRARSSALVAVPGYTDDRHPLAGDLQPRRDRGRRGARRRPHGARARGLDRAAGGLPARAAVGATRRAARSTRRGSGSRSACCSWRRSSTRAGRCACSTSTSPCCSDSASRSCSSTTASSTSGCRPSTRCCCYLLVRLALAGFRPREREEPLIPVARESWLLVGLALLLIGRIVLNVVDSDVIDVGYTSVIGADDLLHGKDLTGYGPVMFLAYVPFELIFPWHGAWDSLPAAHAAALTFDLLTVVGPAAARPAAARGARGPHARDRARLRLGGVPVLDLRAPVEHQRRARGDAARLLAAGPAHARRTRRAARPRHGGQVLPGGAGAAVRGRHGGQARAAARCASRARSRPSAWWRSTWRSRTAACASCGTTRSATRSRARRRSASGACTRRSGWLQATLEVAAVGLLRRARLRPAHARRAPGRGARGRGRDRSPALRQLLAVLLRRLVRAAGAGRDAGRLPARLAGPEPSPAPARTARRRVETDPDAAPRRAAPEPVRARRWLPRSASRWAR